MGDVAQVNNNVRVQKALRRLAADTAPTSLSQLVMWRVASGLDWSTIAQLSQNWANRYELTLAKDFVDHLDTLPEGETGRLIFQVAGTDDTSKPMAVELNKELQGKTVLGLATQVTAEIGRGPRVLRSRAGFGSMAAKRRSR